MAKNNQGNIQTLEGLRQLFIEKILKVEDYLGRIIDNKELNIKYQEINSLYDIPDLGRNFGSIYDKDNTLILGNWLQNLTNNENSILVDFILTREAFRRFLDQDLPKFHSYERFTEILLQIIAILWIIETYPRKYTSYHISVIRQRTDAYEESENILKSNSWVYFMNNAVQQNIPAKSIYKVLIERVKDAITEEKSIVDLAWDLMYWLKAHLPEEISYGLPFYIKKKRHYDLLKTLSKRKYENSSALQLSGIIGKSHNSITISFKQIMDEYGIYWWPNIDILKLKLYPYFLRIKTEKKEHHELIIEKMKTVRYFKFIRESVSENKRTIVGWMDSPLTVYEQLLDYFEKLKRSGFVIDYFLKQIRHKRVTWTISTKKYEPKEEIYLKLLNTTDKKSHTRIIAMDKKYEIASLQKEKEEYFNENVLMFIGSLMSKHLGKSNIIFNPIELVYELCEKNEVDSKNSEKVRDFINQMEIRCRRLEIFDYYLYFREFILFKKALYFEIPLIKNMQIIDTLLEKLEITREMIRLTFMDRIVVLFPDVIYESILREKIENLLEEKDINFICLQLNYHRGLKRSKFLFNEVYDFDKNQWKIT
ncbi:MAG TPA: hypothetical protein VMZ29_03830 [Candidatus Bathyarchaeia archaeon]|nr:hypothetical protein [Candidatus Bathyarchaeia archaeon]